MPQLFLVDQRVVNAIDHQFAQRGVFRSLLVQLVGNVVFEAESLKEVLIDDVGTRRNNCVHHVVADQVDKDLLQTGAYQ